MRGDASSWNERFRQREYIYGTRPNSFVEQEAGRLPDAADILELGGGEGRNAVWLAEQGHRVTMVDYAAAGLQKAQTLAGQRGASIVTLEADLRTWRPDRQWDAVIATYLHFPPDERRGVYRLMQQVLRPGGIAIGEWFRPEQILEGYQSGGPPRIELLVSAADLEPHFEPAGILLLEETITDLDEGTHHRGPAAVVRLIWEKGRNG